MKVVVDTNILILAALKGGVNEDFIFYIALDKDISWIVTEPIFKEYVELAKRKNFHFSYDELREWFSLLVVSTEKAPPDVKIEISGDHNDLKFIECAISVDADYFVTNDKAMFKAQSFMDTKIITPFDFMKIMKEN